MARKPWSEIRDQLLPKQVAAVEAKIARLERSSKEREARDAAKAAAARPPKVTSRTRRPKVVGVALPLTAFEVAAWIQKEDEAQPGFAKAVETELSKLKRQLKTRR